jgi:hypothetical protein
LVDVLNELITSAYANDVYGVIIRDGEIDFEATELRRLELNKTGTSKEAYMKHFYDAIDISPI